MTPPPSKKNYADMRSKTLLTLALAATLAACSTQKAAVGNSSTHADPAVAFVETIIAGAPDTKNITGSANIKLQTGGQSMKLNGSLRMRRDEVIRLQLMLPVIGTEVGRIDFTPDYALVVDRLNKRYAKINYADIDFLSENNISFYTLQALFWNELIPLAGTRATVNDAPAFAADISSGSSFVPVTLAQGSNTFQWQAAGDGRLSSLVITHAVDGSAPSMLTWLYSNFTALAGAQFPQSQSFGFTTTVGSETLRAEITIDMTEIKTSSDWDAETVLSSKYTEIDTRSLLSFFQM